MWDRQHTAIQKIRRLVTTLTFEIEHNDIALFCVQCLLNFVSTSKIRLYHAFNTIDSSAKHTNAIAHATSRTTFGKMLFELWASVGPAGPPFKPHCPKCRAGSQSRWCFSHCRLHLVYSANTRRHALLVQCWPSNEDDWPTFHQHW